MVHRLDHLNHSSTHSTGLVALVRHWAWIKSMSLKSSQIRGAQADDLGWINRLITNAIAQCHLAERVKRLALPGYHYRTHDLD